MQKVLIVDDSFLARKLLRSLLEKMNYQVVGEAESGEKALIKYKTTLPDLVLMDVVMPGIGGIEASKKILAQHPEARIIITSAHMQNNLKAELVKNGLKYLIVKPINEANLADAIQKVLSNAGSNIQMDQGEEEKLRKEMRSYLENLAKSKQGSAVQETREPGNGEEGELGSGEAGEFGSGEAGEPGDSGSGEMDELGSEEAGELGKGMAVTVSHYFSREPLAATVVSGASDKLLLQLENKFENYDFSVEDPVTLCFYSQNTCKICPAGILEIVPKEKSIRVAAEKISLLEEEALDENFPASMQIDFKSEFGARKQAAVIRNLGPYASKIVTKTELNIGEKVSFNINLEDKVISLNAEVTSKKQGMYSFEYDLKTTFIDLQDKRLLKLFVSRLRNSHKEALLKLPGLR
jgi:two-component system chemotaxis response regulator CheY